MSEIEESICNLLQQRKERRDAWIAEEIKYHGHVRNPFTLRPRSVTRLPLPFPAGITDRKLDAFERRRGFHLPRSLRQWLKITNGATGFFGIRPARLHNDMEREMNFWQDWNERCWIPVASDDFGNRFIQLAQSTAEDVEPVCYVEMIGDRIAYVAASNMLTFALLYLEDEFQLHEQNIERAGLVQYYPKRKLRRGAERFRVDWQFNKRYMLLRDSDLKKVKGLPLPWTKEC